MSDRSAIARSFTKRPLDFPTYPLEMSVVHPVPNAIRHIEDRTSKLFNFSAIRIMELLENIQYGLGYIFMTFIAGVTLDYIFPAFDEDRDTQTLFLEIVAQAILLIIAAFYVRKIVKIMPFMFVLNFGKESGQYRPYESTEFQGELMMGVIFISSQTNLIKKVELLSERLYKYLFNVERYRKDA